MRTASRISALLVGLAVAWAAPWGAIGSSATSLLQDPKKQQLDKNGDPLPKYCCARLGSSRLRHPGVVGLAVSPNGPEAVTLGHGYVRGWDLKTGALRFETRLTDRAFADFGNSIVAYSPDGKRIFHGGTEVTALDAQTGNVLSTFPSDDFYNHLCTVLGGEALAGGGRRWGLITIWDLKTGQVTKTLEQGMRMQGMAPTPDGKTLVSVGWKGTKSAISVWDLEKGTLRKKIDGKGLRLRSVAIDSRGQTAAISTADGAVLLCSIKAGEVLNTLPAPPQPAPDLDIPAMLRLIADVPVVFRPGEPVLFVGGADGVIRVWNTMTRTQIRDLPGHADQVRALVVDRKSRSLVSTAGDGAIRVWDFASGKAVTKSSGHHGMVSAVSLRRRATNSFREARATSFSSGAFLLTGLRGNWCPAPPAHPGLASRLTPFPSPRAASSF